jgi:hypothetical protein
MNRAPPTSSRLSSFPSPPLGGEGQGEGPLSKTGDGLVASVPSPGPKAAQSLPVRARRGASKKIAAVLLLFLFAPFHPAHAQNAPVGGGGSCSYSLAFDSTVAQQQAYDNGLYTCLSSGGTWTPEAMIIGDTMANGSAAACNSTNTGMLEWTGSAYEFCNGGSSFTNFANLNPSGGTLGGTSPGVFVELSSGSATAPSLTFQEDTQTGLYWVSSKNLAVTTNGTESAVFTSGGNFNLLGASAAYELDSNPILTIPAADTVYSLAVGNGVLVNDSASGGGTNGEYNTGIGYNALQANTTGYENTGIGSFANQYGTTDLDDTAIGAYAMQGVSATPLTSNSAYITAIGYDALLTVQDVDGGELTAIGALALANAAITPGGDGNGTAIGYAALNTDTSYGNNTAVGYEAMFNTSGAGNVGIGYQALYQDNGTSNIAVGYQAMYAATSGESDCTAIGSYAMSNTNTLNGSTAIGYKALENATNTAGPGSTAVGYEALMNLGNFGGSYSTDDAFGYEAGLNITTGSGNVALGDLAMMGVSATPMTGQNNTAAGQEALYSIQGAPNDNTAGGYQALYSLTTGQSNTAIGYEAAQYATTGGANTAIGYEAMQGVSATPLTTGYGYNTAIGELSLAILRGTADDNTALGYEAGNALTIGTDNTLIGYTAGNLVTGSYNIIVGEGGNITTGSTNILIGNSLTQTTNTSSNQIDIGDTIMVYGDTHLAMHSTALTTAQTSSCPSAAATSIAGNDNAFTVTQSGGTASNTLCVIAFETTWISTPVCSASWAVSSTFPSSALSVSATTTTLTIYGSAGELSEAINVTCTGYE